MALDEIIISREQLLGGLPSRAASMVLFAMESRTAHLMQRSRRAASRLYVEKSAEEAESTFLDALAQGRKTAPVPTIQDLEQYAPDWAALVPFENTALCTALAHLLKEKYHFTRRHVPGLRRALGLEREAVHQAYQQHYHESLESIYVTRISWRERLKWVWARLAGWLEHLSPFWTAFALTITETIGASILAVPIAFARLGVIPGLILLVVLGLTSTLTVAALVEAITRNGNMRYGNAYLGKLVDDYLGRAGSAVLTSALFVLVLLILAAYAIGIATTLYDLTSVPAALWVVALGLLYITILRGKSLYATVASAMAISAINILILLLLIILAIPHIRLANLQYQNIPFVDSPGFDTGLIELIFGVVLTGYFGHTSAANAAKVVLRRDPSGRALLWGNIAAFAVVIVLTCLWVTSVAGAITPETLAETSGTVIAPLSDVVGPVVLVLGSIFVLLGMGMAGIHLSLALSNQIREWLSALEKPGVQQSPRPAGPLLALRNALASEAAQFWVSILPIVALFGVVTWQLLTGQGSFTGVLGLVGVVTVPVIGGIIPILLLAASRRKGEYVPGTVLRWLGNPLLLGAVYLLYLAGIFLHGLVIWQDWASRTVALLSGIVVCVMTVVAARQGAFRGRTILELRTDQNADDETTFQSTASGSLLPVGLTFNYASDEQSIQSASGAVPHPAKLRSLVFQLPVLATPKLKIWTHKITREDHSVSLPVSATVQHDGQTEHFRLHELDGQVVVPIRTDTAYRVTIDF